MLYQRAFAAELRALWAAIFTTLLVITTTLTLIRILGQAANGKLDPQSVFIILGYLLLNYTPMMLNLTVFAAVLMVMTRMYRDSEMVVWSASGLSLRAWVVPALRFAIPVVALGAFISLAVAPWANQQVALYRDTFEKRDDISRIAAGQFRESAAGNRVFYVQEIDANGARVNKVFIRVINGDRQVVVAADHGRIETRTEGGQAWRYLILEQGRRYELAPNGAQARLMQFERYTLRLDDAPPPPADLSTPKLTPTLSLLDRTEPPFRAELMWRLGLPFVGIVLAILAVPLSIFNPRSGRATPFIVAILVFAIYLNMMTLMQNQIANGRVAFLTGLVGVHLAVLGVALLLLWLRGRPQGRSWRARFAKAVPA
jgi:lipopolysaccharide export system permease protein